MLHLQPLSTCLGQQVTHVQGVSDPLVIQIAHGAPWVWHFHRCMSLLTTCDAEGASLDDVIASAEARLVSVGIPFVTFRHEPADTVADLLRVTTHMPGGKCTYARDGRIPCVFLSSPGRLMYAGAVFFCFQARTSFFGPRSPSVTPTAPSGWWCVEGSRCFGPFS